MRWLSPSQHTSIGDPYVDEGLAVGDAAFKKKYLGKIGDVAKSGRAVLFVSHNAHAIRSLCSRAILLKDGQVEADGKPLEVLTQYEHENRGVRILTDPLRDSQFRRGSGEVRFTSIEVLDSHGKPRHDFEPGETIRFSVAYECRTEVSELSLLVDIKCEQGDQNVTTFRHLLSADPVPAGYRGHAVIELAETPLRPGCFPLLFWLGRLWISPYDIVDELIEPLVIYSTRDSEALGYDPANAEGLVSLESKLVEHRPVLPVRLSHWVSCSCDAAAERSAALTGYTAPNDAPQQENRRCPPRLSRGKDIATDGGRDSA